MEIYLQWGQWIAQCIPACDRAIQIDEKLAGRSFHCFEIGVCAGNLAKTMKNHTIFDCALPAEIGSGALYADTQQLIAGTMTPEQMAEDCQNVLDESR